MNTNIAVPADYDELYRLHFMPRNSFVRSILRRRMPLSSPDDIEDMMMEIIERCIRFDIITRFDPTKANFGGMIFNVIRSVSSNWTARVKRDPVTGLRNNAILDKSPDDDSKVVALDNLFRDERLGSSFEFSDRIRSLLEWAESCVRRNENKRDRSMVDFVNLLIEGYTPQEIAEKLGVTASTIHNWRTFVREENQ